MLTDDELWKFWWARQAIPDGDDDSMEAEFVAAARAIEVEVLKRDEALLRQALEAIQGMLNDPGDDHIRSSKWQAMREVEAALNQRLGAAKEGGQHG